MSIATPTIAWQANQGPQRAFIACPVREILYGGAKGGGKTDAIGPKALKHITMYGQWATVLILRESFPQLTEIMERMRPLCLLAGGKYNKVEKTWRFPSGARILFGHLGDGCDPYWGQEYSLIIIDEVTRTIKTEADYLKLLGSLRNSHGVPCSVILTSNPGGEGHEWIKARFMGVPPFTVQRDEKTGLERVFIPASLKDNPKLGPEYRATLEQLPDAERRAFLDGDWNAFEGQVFDLVRGVHIWTWAQFKERTGHDRPPVEWNRFRTMDWGYAKPFALHWYAVDHDGRAYVYREWYGVMKDGKGQVQANVGLRLEPEAVAEKVAGIERSAGETMAQTWTGPDLGHTGRGDHGGGRPINEHFQAHEVYWTFWDAGSGSRIAAKMAFHQRMAHAEGEWPGIVFIDEECPHAIRTIPALEYDRHRVEDVDTTAEDHAYDGIKAFCLMRPWAPPVPKAKRDGWRERAESEASNDWMVS